MYDLAIFVRKKKKDIDAPLFYGTGTLSTYHLHVISLLRRRWQANEVVPKPPKLEVDVLHVDVVLLPVLARRVGRVELAVCWARSTAISMIDQHLQFYRYVHHKFTLFLKTQFLLLQKLCQAMQEQKNKKLTTSDLLPHE